MSTAAVLSLQPVEAPNGDNPFLRVAGLPLITRQLLGLSQGGVEKIWLVPGPHSEKVRALIESDERLGKLSLEITEGSPKEVSAKALAAASSSADRVLFIEGPLAFGTGLVRHLATAPLPAEGLRYSAETEFFALPSKAVSSAAPLAAAAKAQVLVAEKRPEAKDAFLLPVRSRSEARSAKLAIFRTLTKPTSGWVSKNVNSKISLPISWIVSESPITPNMLTAFATFVGALSFTFLSRGDQWGVFWGGFCFQLASALDRCDGEIARCKFKASPYGEWIDTLGDNLTYTLFVAGLTEGMYARTQALWTRWVGYGLLLCVFLVLGLMYSYLLRNTKSGSLVAVYKDMEARYEGREKPLAYRLLDKIRFMGKRDFFSLTTFVVCALNGLEFLFWAAAFTITCMLVYVISGRMSLPTGQAEGAPATSK
ncbi:MAG: CDP-alcohol phosphatidyltransferase family protein [Bdellovibrionota bacterium]